MPLHLLNGEVTDGEMDVGVIKSTSIEYVLSSTRFHPCDDGVIGRGRRETETNLDVGT
jgi:hypothetical protein